MPILLLILLAGVLAYFIWRNRTSTLTRHCRWRAERSKGQWRCTSCGAVQPGEAQPRHCLNPAGSRRGGH
ncbi:hypothetical protein PXK01_11315 [Phaeobacter sp. PT47_59]|uniref:hypothetical protein n=1 Tax=Phaeobacter sp. PT47_59 TaxID=3029979 RepID=UPI0023807B26|nr:hypothetical protein [Phaeobacter sp. PT47_59]MDE4174746.1 hypothetical protein [Phaeobacter sp. PT47_59]